MSVIAIVGAGTLGGTLAHTIAARDLYTQVRLVDDARDIAAGKALDIVQAGPIERFRTQLVADRGPAATVGADAVILTGPASSPEAEWDDAGGLVQLRQIADANRLAVLICAGAEHSGLVERGVRDAGIDRRRLLGSAPEAYRAAVRAIVALEVGYPASAVSLTLLGRLPHHAVVVWSQASVGGELLEERISATRMARLRDRVAALWPPGPYALAAAATRVVGCIASGNGRRPCCFVVVDGELGLRRRAMAAPVELDALGVIRIAEPSLNARERAALEAARVD